MGSITNKEMSKYSGGSAVSGIQFLLLSPSIHGFHFIVQDSCSSSNLHFYIPAEMKKRRHSPLRATIPIQMLPLHISLLSAEPQLAAREAGKLGDRVYS